MNDFTPDDLEATVRDVLAHQAESVSGGADVLPAVALSDDPDVISVPASRWRRARAFTASTVAVAAAAAIIVLVAAVAPRGAGDHNKNAPSLAAALSATTATGSFSTSYAISERAGTTVTTTTPCSAVISSPPASVEHPPPSVTSHGLAPSVVYSPGITSGDCSGTSTIVGPDVTGSGSIVVSPLNISTNSEFNGTQVRVDATDSRVKESSGSQSQNSSLSDFATITEQTLGTREGAVAMLSLSSPTGYLDLTQEQAAGAQPAGNANGLAYFEVTLSPEQMATVSGTSPEEAKTITAALSALAGMGYTGTTMRIGVGGDGLIHSVVSTTNFTDGGAVTLTATFSNFGSANSASTTVAPTNDVSSTTVESIIPQPPVFSPPASDATPTTGGPTSPLTPTSTG
jgi:hypothetical protein